MARQVLFICLVLIAMIGSASAVDLATTASAPTTSSSSSSASAVVPNSAVGNTDDGSGDGIGDNVFAAPIGGPLPAGAIPLTLDGPAPSPSGSGAPYVVGVPTGMALAAVIEQFF